MTIHRFLKHFVLFKFVILCVCVAVEKITVILQFMRSKDVMELTFHQFHPSVQATLAYGFSLLTQLIQDKNSNVCVRAKYCVSSISGSSLEVCSFAPRTSQ